MPLSQNDPSLDYDGSWGDASEGWPVISFATEEEANKAYVLAWRVVALPQADPNGLFSPTSAEGTWVMCKDPKGGEVKPVYIEPRIVVSPFKMEAK
jgi:hypothetical protein